MLSNVVRVLRSGIRSLLPLVVDLGGGELLEGNRSLDRLLHIIVHGDGDRHHALGLLRSEGSFTLAQHRLAVLLVNELSLQGVFLTRNQTLVGDLIDNLGTSNNLMRTLLEVSVSGDLRSLLKVLGGHSLVIVIDVLVLTNRVRVVLIGRVVLTVLIHLGGSQRLEGNRSLNRLSNLIAHGDGDSLSAISVLRSELVALGLTKNGLTVLLGNQLGIQSVFLARNQTLVGNLVHNLGTSNNLTQVTLEVRISGHLRAILRSYSLILIVDVLVLTNRVRVVLIGRVVLTVLIHLGGSQRLEGNRSLNRLSNLIAHGDGDSLSAISVLRSELVALGLTKNGLTVLLGNQLGIQSVFLARNQTLVGNLVHNLGTSNNLTQATLEVRISGHLRGVLLVAVTRGPRLVRLGRLRRLARLLRSSRTVIRRLVRLRSLGSLRRRGLYRLGLRRLTGLRLRRFLRLGRLLTLRVTRLLRLTSLVAVTRRTRNFFLRGGGLRSRGLRLILGGHGLIIVIDVLVLTDFVRLVIVRGVLTLVIDNLGSQRLEGNCSLNRLSNLIAHGDGDSLSAISVLRSELVALGLTKNGLTVLLGNQLGIQEVFLTRNQTLVGNLVHNLSTSNNLTQVTLEVRVGRNNRVLVGGYGLVLVVDVLVLSDVVRLLRSGIRGVFTLVVDVGGGQFFKRNRSLNRLLHVVRNGDLNFSLTICGLRLNSSLALAQNGLAVLLGNQLSTELVLLTRNQVEVINSVDDRSTSNNFLGAVCKVRIGGNARLGGYGLVLVVDVIVLSDVIRGALVGRLIVAILVDLGGGQVLERNSCLDRLGHIIVNGDLNNYVAVSRIRGESLLTGTQNSLAIHLGDELSLQGVFLTRNQVVELNGVVDLSSSDYFVGIISELSLGEDPRGILLVAVTRGPRLVRLGRLRRLARLLRSSRTVIRRLVRLRSLGSLRRRGLYRLGLRRLTGLRLRRFLRLGRLLTLRVTRLLRLKSLASLRGRRILRGRRLRGLTLATITRRTRHDVSRSRRRSGGLGRLVRLYGLGLVLDVGVLGDVILLTSGGILAVLVNSSGGQVLESNCLVNSLGNTLINGDLNLYLTLRSRWCEGLLTVTDYWVLTVVILDLGTQLCIQSVFLARNQVVVLNRIGNDGASLDLVALSLLSLGADGWLHLRSYGLRLIIDVAVFGNLLLFVRVRSFLTVLINLLGVEVFVCDGSLDDALNIVVDLNINDLLTCRLLRGEGYIALADDLVLTLIILSLVTQLSLQGVFLTWHQVGVLNGVLDSNASLYLRSVVKVSLGLDRRVPLGVNGLLLIVNVFVSSNHVFIGGAGGLVAVLVYLGRYKLLEGNRSVNSRICLLVDGDLNLLFTGGLLRSQFRRAFTQYGFAIFLGDEFCLQGVLLTRNKILIRHSVNNRGTLLYTVAILDLGLRVNLRIPLGIDGLRLIINVLVLRNEVAIAGIVRDILAVLIHLVGVQLLISNGSSNRVLHTVIDIDLYLNVPGLTRSFKGLRTGTKNSVLAVLASSLVTQLSL